MNSLRWLDAFTIPADLSLNTFEDLLEAFDEKFGHWPTVLECGPKDEATGVWICRVRGDIELRVLITLGDDDWRLTDG